METQLSIRIPKGLMDQIDEEVELQGYSSRSEFVKASIRAHLLQLANMREINKEYAEARQEEKGKEKT